ncbi:MAG: molybdopterin-dependent oxidoreductase [Pirellulales bacterium]
MSPSLSEAKVEPQESVPRLRITGSVGRELSWDLADLRAIDSKWQVEDVSQIDPRRSGRAVRLAGLLEACRANPDARYLTLHATRDDFHASIPLAPVRDSAVLIYEQDGHSLPVRQGGPYRFLIPDFGACHTSEIDECANVKFVEWMELGVGKGIDNRPQDEQQHEELHRREAAADAVGRQQSDEERS